MSLWEVALTGRHARGQPHAFFLLNGPNEPAGEEEKSAAKGERRGVSYAAEICLLKVATHGTALHLTCACHFC